MWRCDQLTREGGVWPIIYGEPGCVSANCTLLSPFISTTALTSHDCCHSTSTDLDGLRSCLQVASDTSVTIMASVCSDAHTLVDRPESVWDPDEKSLADTSSVYSHKTSGVLIKEKTYYYEYPRGRPKGRISRVLRGICSFPIRTMQTATTFAYSLLSQSSADVRVRGAVLAHAAVMQKRFGGEKGASHAAQDPLAIIPVSRKVVQARAKAVERQLDAQVDTPPVSTYLDLLDLICIVLRVPPGSYSEPLIRRIWQMLIQELQRGRSNDFVAALSRPECAEEDVGTVLRHVALSHLGAWKPSPPPQDLSSGSVQKYTKNVAFSSDTYTHYLALEKAFYEVLCGLLDRRPTAVRRALDGYAHLVWFKFASPSPVTPDTINFAYVIDTLSYVYHQYWKRFDPTPSGEVESLISYLATSPTATPPKTADESLYPRGKDFSDLTYAIQHVCISLSTIATASLPRKSSISSPSTPLINWNTPGIFQLAKDHPGLFCGELVHPALPIILFIAELVNHSAHTVTLLTSDSHDLTVSSSFLDSLAMLWQYSFILPYDDACSLASYSGPSSQARAGSGVSKEKREYAMQLATCFLLANMSASAYRAEQLGDSTAMDSLVRHVSSTPQLESWLWDVASKALILRITSRKERDRTRTDYPLSKGKDMERTSWGIYEDRLPLVRHLVRRIIEAKTPPPFVPSGEPRDVEKLVWMLEEGTEHLALPILKSVLASATSSKPWITALEIFDGCHDLNSEHLVSSLCKFSQMLMKDKPRRHAKQSSRPSARHTAPAASSSSSQTPPRLGRTSPDGIPLFMPHVTDRFLMLILSAARRNEALRRALHRSAETKRALADLVAAVDAGTFDRGAALDSQQREWRARACRDVSLMFL